MMGNRGYQGQQQRLGARSVQNLQRTPVLVFVMLERGGAMEGRQVGGVLDGPPRPSIYITGTCADFDFK